MRLICRSISGKLTKKLGYAVNSYIFVGLRSLNTFFGIEFNLELKTQKRESQCVNITRFDMIILMFLGIRCETRFGDSVKFILNRWSRM